MYTYSPTSLKPLVTSKLPRATIRMAAKLEDVLEVVAMAIALMVLLVITYVLHDNGMFRPVRPARVQLFPFLAAVKPVSRRSNAAETQEKVLSILRGAGVVQPTIQLRKTPLSRPDVPGGDSSQAQPQEPEPAEVVPGDVVAIHFGHVGLGEKGAQGSSAGVVLVAGRDAVTDASCASWRGKLSHCAGIDVEPIFSEGPGLEVAYFPWRGRLSEFILRHRVTRRLGLCLEKEFRSRKQRSPCFVEVVSPLEEYITLHVFTSPVLHRLREPHGLAQRSHVR